MPVTRQHTNKQRISRRPRIHLALIAARPLVMLLAGCTVLAACTGGPAQPLFKRHGRAALRQAQAAAGAAGPG